MARAPATARDIVEFEPGDLETTSGEPSLPIPRWWLHPG